MHTIARLHMSRLRTCKLPDLRTCGPDALHVHHVLSRSPSDLLYVQNSLVFRFPDTLTRPLSKVVSCQRSAGGHALAHMSAHASSYRLMLALPTATGPNPITCPPRLLCRYEGMTADKPERPRPSTGGTTSDRRTGRTGRRRNDRSRKKPEQGDRKNSTMSNYGRQNIGQHRG